MNSRDFCVYQTTKNIKVIIRDQDEKTKWTLKPRVMNVYFNVTEIYRHYGLKKE